MSVSGSAARATTQAYEVQPGDTLGLIARRFHTSVSALRDANGIDGDAIRIGQHLQIPGEAQDPAAPATASATPTDQSPAIPLYRGRSDTNAVALTFDAGADVGYAKLILDTLERNSIHATFGMTGQWARANPELVKQMAAGGHEFINHTWDHQSFTGVSTKTRPLTQTQRWAELDQAQDIILRLTDRTTLPYFRAPFGDQDRSVEVDAGLRGYRYDVLWTVDSRGWANASAGEIVANSSRGAVPGAIIVMHVGRQSQDGPALQAVIDAIRQKSLAFATVSQLVGGR